VEDTAASAAAVGGAAAAPPPRPQRVPLAHQVISAVLALLVIEWLLYVRRGRT
jgi:hypothetical protein